MNFRQAVRKEWIRWLRFMRHDFLRILTYYALVNIVLVLVFILLQEHFQAGLDLKPQLDSGSEGVSFPVALALLPLTLWFENLGIRLLPWIFLHDIFKLDSIEVQPVIEKPRYTKWQIKEKRKWRVWLYHNTRSFYIVVSALWHSLLHQLNVFAADPLGRVAYFVIQLVAGYILAWIYTRKGFWQCYTVHVSWDFLLVGFTIVIGLLSSFA